MAQFKKKVLYLKNNIDYYFVYTQLPLKQICNAKTIIHLKYLPAYTKCTAQLLSFGSIRSM